MEIDFRNDFEGQGKEGLIRRLEQSRADTFLVGAAGTES